MNFDLTDEQQMLSDTTRDVLSRTYDTESRNKVVDSELGWSREVWQQLAEIGILGLGLEPGLDLVGGGAGGRPPAGAGLVLLAVFFFGGAEGG